MPGKDYLKNLPSISSLLERKDVKEEITRSGRGIVTVSLRKAVDMVRREPPRGSMEPGTEELLENIMDRFRFLLKRARYPGPRRVINGTGIIIHTNLGRAPLPGDVSRLLGEQASSYIDLELDLESGRRGSRNAHVEQIIKDITGCEAALVVNNNAAALLLVLSALGKGRETVISRGELVEIGGGFRIPQILSAGGTNLVEVGTTNRTRISDYEGAITESTALFLKVHRSNFYMKGFVEEASLSELIELGRRHSIPLVYDMGSGALFDMDSQGFKGEQGAASAINHGAHLVTFSCDKLMGGPQGGIIAGKSDLVDACKVHPLARAVRIDRLNLTAISNVLSLFYDEKRARENIPVLKMLYRDEKEIKNSVVRVKKKIEKAIRGDLSLEMIGEEAECGGGTLPGLALKTWCLSLSSGTMTPDRISALFRDHEPPVVGRIGEGRYLIDFRTVLKHEEGKIVEAALNIFSGKA